VSTVAPATGHPEGQKVPARRPVPTAR